MYSDEADPRVQAAAPDLAHKKLTPLGPYSMAMPGALWWSWGGGWFLMSEVPLYSGEANPQIQAAAADLAHKKQTPLGPCSRTKPRALGWS